MEMGFREIGAFFVVGNKVGNLMYEGLVVSCFW